MHTIYKIEKAHLVAATQRVGSTYAHEDIPESSRSRSQRRSMWKKKIGSWMKAIFGKCTYATECAYETQLEQRQQRGEHLPPLPPIPPPPQFELPSLSDIEYDDVLMMTVSLRSDPVHLRLSGRRHLRATDRDRSRYVPFVLLATLPLLTVRDMLASTLMTMTTVAQGLLRVLARLLY
jgi:hypothetical protein